MNEQKLTMSNIHDDARTNSQDFHNNSSSINEFHPVEDVAVVRPETLSDSFVARSNTTIGIREKERSDKEMNSQAIFQESMNLSQVFNASLQRLENTMSSPPTNSKKCMTAENSSACKSTQEELPGLVESRQSAASLSEQQRQQWQQSLANDCLVAPIDAEDNDTRAAAKNTKNVDEEEAEGDEEDHASQLSDSYHDEPLDKEENAHKKEREIRKSLLLTILSALGAMFVMKWIQKCCIRYNSRGGDTNDANNEAVEAMTNDGTTNLQSTLNAGTNGGGGGGGGNASTSGPQQQGAVQQMAIQAAQNAASSAAQGARAMATASSTGTGQGGMTTGMIVAGAMVAGTVVVGGAALGAGGNRQRLEDQMWLCNATVEPKQYQGHVVLYLEGLEDTAWLSEPEQRVEMEQAFEQVYRSVSGECQGTYQRILESVKLHGHDWEEIDGSNSSSKTYLRTNWTASVWCNQDCPEEEPLFYIRPDDLTFDELNNDSLALRQRQLDAARYLQESEGQFLLSFASNLTRSFSSLVHGSDSPKQVVVFDGYTLSPQNGSIVERIGSDLDVADDILSNEEASSAYVEDVDIPLCEPSPSQTNATGSVEMMVENLDCTRPVAIESLFRRVFNDFENGCDGLFQRVMRDVEVTACTVMRSTTTEGREITFADMALTATVTCDGCSDPEPLFLESYQRRSYLRHRQLEAEIFFELFVNELSEEMDVQYGTPAAPLDIFYAATLSTVGDDDTVVESIGQALAGRPLQNSNGGQASSNISVDMSEEIPLCETSSGESVSYEDGQVNILIENMPPELYDWAATEKRELVESQFKASYNSISGMCEGMFERIVHNATLLNYTFAIRGDGVPYIDTTWEATASCSGCNPKEPLFMASSGSQQASSNNRDRKLQMDLNSMLGQFASHFSEALDTLLHGMVTNDDLSDDWKRIDIFYLTSLSSDGSEVVQSTGYHPLYYKQVGNSVGRPNSDAEDGDSENSIQIVDQCLKDLVLEDSNFDNMLDKTEYVRFVRRIVGQLDSTVNMHELQKNVASFESLPINVQENFHFFALGGEIPIHGDKLQMDVPTEQEQFLENFCLKTSEIILLDLQGGNGQETAQTGTATPTSGTTATPFSIGGAQIMETSTTPFPDPSSTTSSQTIETSATASSTPTFTPSVVSITAVTPTAQDPTNGITLPIMTNLIISSPGETLPIATKSPTQSPIPIMTYPIISSPEDSLPQATAPTQSPFAASNPPNPSADDTVPPFTFSPARPDTTQAPDLDGSNTGEVPNQEPLTLMAVTQVKFPIKKIHLS